MSIAFAPSPTLPVYLPPFLAASFELTGTGGEVPFPPHPSTASIIPVYALYSRYTHFLIRCSGCSSAYLNTPAFNTQCLSSLPCMHARVLFP